MQNYKYLNNINFPSDIKKLNNEELKILSDEVRSEMIDAVSKTGGHLGAGLGVVELTVALHHIFDTPKDKLIWDVGHQSYPHKILTGRKDKIRTLRQGSGLSGFTKRSESEFDPFGAAHSSTSISAGLGIATANKLSNKSDQVIAVIGDGAMSAGMAYEAMNNAGDSKTKKDSKRGKATLISLLGYKNAIKYASKLKKEIFNSLVSYGNNAGDLKETIEFILSRNK